MSEQQTAPEDKDAQLVTNEWVYTGQRVRGGKRVYAWGTLALGKIAIGHYNKPLVPASVGGVYRFHESADGKTFKTSGEYAPVYLRRHTDQGEVLAWSAQDEAAKQELAAKSALRKAANVAPLDDFLKKLGNMSRSLTRSERRALAARCLEEIYGGAML